MKYRVFAGLLAVLLALSIVPFSFAQTATTGQLIGTVKDPAGAVVPGAKTTLTGAAGEKREVAADATGNFRFALLTPGT